MIGVEEAKRIMMEHVPVLAAEFQLADDAVGGTLAADVIAPNDHPLFDMSAVDGYAIGDAEGPWTPAGSIAAGQVLDHRLHHGECVRIFTGAMVPDGAHAVVMQERCTLRDGMLVIDGPVPPEGANIRRRGESFRKDELLLPKGTRMNPAAVGLVASSGLKDVMVTIGPAVSIVRTGGEFIEEGTEATGRIHSSNEWMLIAAVRSAGLFTEDDALIARDDAADLRNAIERAMEEGDVVITTGGVSVGDHDLVRGVLEEMGATIHFHGVKQKPGKPMLFATLKDRPVFGLPGNPRAVLVCWYEYVLPFLRAMEGASDPWLSAERLPMAHGVALKGERAEFRAATVREGRVHLLPDEGSHMLATLTVADALAFFPSDAREVRSGDRVEVHHLPRW